MSNLRDFKDSTSRRKFLENALKIKLANIGNFSFTEEQVLGRNIENLIGATQIPLGIAGPLKINVIPSKAKNLKINLEITSSKTPHNDKSSKEYYIPLATTEGALVASISRGCKAISESGGATVEVENVGMSRGPVFKTDGIKHNKKIKQWIEKNFKKIANVAEKTSSHLTLLKIEVNFTGRSLYARFSYNTGDAMGMNMATFATEQAVQLIEQETKAKCIALAGNYDLDKKPSWLNFTSGRGKKVWAEVILPGNVVQDVLKTTPEAIVEVVEKKCHLGSIMSGSLGFNSHFANIAAALFASTGQDLAHVVEASLGITSAEVLEDGSLYFSIYLPSLQVGTVGGGTHLPTQQETLKIMNVANVLEYSVVCGAAILAGELSLIASLAEGSLTKAHQKLGRKGK